MSPSYRGIMRAKNGDAVPVFANGAPMYSLYNPRRDAEAFAARCAPDGESGAGFAVVFGAGTGAHLAAAAARFPSLRILAVEAAPEDIGFLRPVMQPLPASVSVCSLDGLKRAFLSLYSPLLYGAVRILCLESWKNACPEGFARGNAILREALEETRNDIATQGRLGKIWFRNIILNASLPAGGKTAPLKLPKEKRACIAGAGPTLDSDAALLGEGRGSRYVIAADTAFPALAAQGVFPDAVVTIDGQNASVRHFSALPRFARDFSSARPPVLFAGLCCNPAAPRLFRALGFPVVFVRSGHPLEELAAEYAWTRGAPDGFLPRLSPGAGTVLVSAFETARAAGFSAITLHGADFSFPGGKPYCRGTYLDYDFFTRAGRLSPAESLFTALMYRGRLVKQTPDGGAPSTPLLLAYKKSLEELMGAPPEAPRIFWSGGDFLRGFAAWFAARLEALLAGGDDFPALCACLPLAAWARADAAAEKSGVSPARLAYDALKRYTPPV